MNGVKVGGSTHGGMAQSKHTCHTRKTNSFILSFIFSSLHAMFFTYLPRIRFLFSERVNLQAPEAIVFEI